MKNFFVQPCPALYFRAASAARRRGSSAAALAEPSTDRASRGRGGWRRSLVSRPRPLTREEPAQPLADRRPRTALRLHPLPASAAATSTPPPPAPSARPSPRRCAGRDQHVVAHQGEVVAAERAAIRGLEVLRPPHRPPLGSLSHARPSTSRSAFDDLGAADDRLFAGVPEDDPSLVAAVVVGRPELQRRGQSPDR